MIGVRLVLPGGFWIECEGQKRDTGGVKRFARN